MTMNTRIFYLYRDAGNNKVGGEEVIAGVFNGNQYNELLSTLSNFPEKGFIPEKLGLSPLRDGFASGAAFDADLDHDWHEWEGVELTEDEQTLPLSTEEMMQRVEHVRLEGWDAYDALQIKKAT